MTYGPSENTLTSLGSSPPSNVQKDPSTASNQLSIHAPRKVDQEMSNMPFKVELTLGEIACLKKCNRLRSYQAHSILQVEVTFSIKIKAY